jgi:hypothetical protein
MLPCADEVSRDVCGSENHILIQGEQGHADADLCSPFCLCQCCNTNIASNHALKQSLSTAYNKVHQTIYRGTPGKDVPYSILQPPQV